MPQEARDVGELERWYKTLKLERAIQLYSKSRYKGNSSKGGQTSWEKEWIVNGGIRLSIHEVLDVSCKE